MILVHRAVLHIVDPHGTGGFQLSDRELKLSDEVRSFLTGHITQSLEDISLRPARFDGRRSGLRALIENWRRDQGSYLSMSREIAQQLLSIVKDDRRISGSVLAVCEYENDEAAFSLAILKLDPSSAFRPTVRQKSKETFVELEAVQDVIPATGDRLQKSAFFHQLTQMTDYDLLVLDRQQASSDDAAQFFTEKFLCATATFDNRELTRRFYETVVESLNVLRPVLSRNQADSLRESMNVVLEKGPIDVDQWVKSRRLPAPAKKELMTSLQHQLPINSFTPDPQTVEKLSRVRTFRGDGGFLLKLDADRYQQIVQKIEVLSGEDEGYTEITLNVAGFRELIGPTTPLSSSISVETPGQTSGTVLQEGVAVAWYSTPEFNLKKYESFELGVELPLPDWLAGSQVRLLMSLSCPDAEVRPETQSFSIGKAMSTGARYFTILPLIDNNPSLRVSLYLERAAMFVDSYEINISSVKPQVKSLER